MALKASKNNATSPAVTLASNPARVPALSKENRVYSASSFVDRGSFEVTAIFLKAQIFVRNRNFPHRKTLKRIAVKNFQ